MSAGDRSALRFKNPEDVRRMARIRAAVARRVVCFNPGGERE